MAKFLLAPGTYAAGQAIPLIPTAFRSCAVRSDGDAATVRGSGCWCGPAQYDVSARVIAAAGTAVTTFEITQDGDGIADAIMAIPAAAGTLTTQAVTQISAVDTSRISVRAVTDATITGGNLIVTRRA